MMRSLKKITLNSIFFILAGLLTLLLMEGYIRYGEIQSLSNFEVDSVHGKRLRARVPMLYLMEGFYMGEVNEYGYLGPGYAPEKKETTTRIALIGDSYVEAFQVFGRDHFRTIMEDSLREQTELPVQVLNFGRSGFTLADMYVYYRNFAAGFNPEFFLIFLHNDDLYAQSHQALLPEVKTEGEGITISHDFVQGNAYKKYQQTRFFREHSAYLRMANNGVKLIKEGMLPNIVLGKLHLLMRAQETTAAANGEERNMKEEDLQIPMLYQEILETLAKDERVILVLAEEPGPAVQDFINQQGLQIIALWHTLEALKKEGTDSHYWPGTRKYGHWNQQGHEAIGKTLANQLKAKIKTKE